jgi:hypothetical protein
MGRPPLEPWKQPDDAPLPVKSRRQPALLFAGLMVGGALALTGASFLTPEQVAKLSSLVPAPPKNALPSAAPAAPTAPVEPVVEAAPAGPGPIPGPPDDLALRHLEGVTVEAKRPRLVILHPRLATAVNASVLLVTFRADATVAEANAALRKANVVVISEALGVLSVRVLSPDDRDISPTEEAQSVLTAERAVASVALSPVPGDGALRGAEKGFASKDAPSRCDHASARLEKRFRTRAHMGKVPWCKSAAMKINGKSLDVAMIKFETGEWVAALLEGEKIFPLEVKVSAVDSPHNVLGLSADEIAANVSAELTGREHWVLRTRQGQFTVGNFLSELDGRVKPPPLEGVRKQFAPALAPLEGARAGCFDSSLQRDKATQGAVVNVMFKIHPDGRVTDVSTAWTSPRGDGAALELSAKCLRDAAAALKFPPSTTEDIWEWTEVYSVYGSTTGR